jgi:hypothetical protein
MIWLSPFWVYIYTQNILGLYIYIKLWHYSQ